MKKINSKTNGGVDLKKIKDSEQKKKKTLLMQENSLLTTSKDNLKGKKLLTDKLDSKQQKRNSDDGKIKEIEPPHKAKKGKKIVTTKTKKTKDNGLKIKKKENGLKKPLKDNNEISPEKSKEVEGKFAKRSIKSVKEKAGKKSGNKSSFSLQNVPSFNEETFKSIICENNINSVVKLLKGQVSEQVQKNKNQIFSDYKYLLNVICFKIPFCPKRLVKLRLKHSLVDESSDVCLIVKDLERGRKFDFEPTIHYYEDLLKEKGIKGIKTIIPFNQLKKEYGSYEMKIKLSNLYDYFICDGAIVGHVFGFLGKHFQKPRSTVHAVRMNTPNIAREIKKALYKTSVKQGEKGTMISVPVATHNMSTEQITDNILTVVKQLKTNYPGGFPNIRSLYVKINIKGTIALPLYISMAAPPEVTPIVVGPKEQKLKELKIKANSILTKFNMTSLGNLKPTDKNLQSRKRQAKEIGNHQQQQPPSTKNKKKNSEKLTNGNEGKQNKSKKKRNQNSDEHAIAKASDEEQAENSDVSENNVEEMNLFTGNMMMDSDTDDNDDKSSNLDEEDESDDEEQ